MSPVIETLDPTAEAVKQAPRQLAPRLEDLTGKRVGFRMQWPRFDVFMDRFEELFREQYKPKAVLRMADRHSSFYSPEKRLKEDEFNAQIDWAVIGLAA